MTVELVDKAQRMYDSRRVTMAEIAATCQVVGDGLGGHIVGRPRLRVVTVG